MQNLTDEGQNLVNHVTQRYNLSNDAVVHMLIAVNNGNGSMAQFNCPELGGSGQWMRGGMTMVGDMFNYNLKATVDNLCNELSIALATTQIFPVTQSNHPWWPAELGTPTSSGNQNNMRYAIFPNRLAVENSGQVTVYDTLDHQIGGVSQQQGGNTSLTFNSQYGVVFLDNLPVVSGLNNMLETRENSMTFESTNSEDYQSANNSQEVLNLIEQLAQLRNTGAITENDFLSKKSELLNRI